jgi:hypothetical protein
MIRRWQALLLSLICFLGGCASGRPPDAQPFREVSEPRPGFAILYIYRPHHNIGRLVWPEVFLNEQKIVGLRNEGYTVVYVKPGSYRVRTEGSPLSAMPNIPGEFQISSNESYFLKFDRSYNRFTAPAGPLGTPSPTFTTNYERWTLVPRPMALTEISNCFFVPPYVQVVSP